MRKLLPFCIVALVALATVGSGTALYWIKRPAQTTADTDKKSAVDPQHILGNSKAPVTLEEFGDFQCPPCGRLSDPINKLEAAFRPNLRIVFRNFPLPVHAHAQEAALAAEAAALQGKFWPMHDILFREQGEWSKAANPRALFGTYASTIGLDVDRFNRDVESERVKETVDKDQKSGASVGVRNTPTIFIDNQVVDPKLLAPDELYKAVDAKLKEKNITR